MDFAQRLRILRNQAGITQEELALKLDVSRPAVGNWESGKARPRLDKLNQLAELLHVPITELLDVNEGATNVVGTSAMVPLLGWTHMGEPTDEEASDTMIEVPAEVAEAHPRSFCLHTQGDCMNKRYPPDSIVMVDPDMEPTNGCAVLVETVNYESYIHVFNRGASTLMLSPDSTNDEYVDIVVSPDTENPLTIKGVVCWYQADKDLRDEE